MWGIKIKGYFADKWKGIDEKQVKALSDEIHWALIHGDEEEAGIACEAIRTRERMQRVTLLGEAAWEYIADCRATLGIDGCRTVSKSNRIERA